MSESKTVVANDGMVCGLFFFLRGEGAFQVIGEFAEHFIVRSLYAKAGNPCSRIRVINLILDFQKGNIEFFDSEFNCLRFYETQMAHGSPPARCA